MRGDIVFAVGAVQLVNGLVVLNGFELSGWELVTAGGVFIAASLALRLWRA